MQIKNKTMVFKVSLLEIKPEIWREIEVPATYSFWDLHVSIQDAMGWLDCHLHAFRILDPKTEKVKEIGIPSDERFQDDPEILPGWEEAIADYFINPGDQTSYEYDFGDCWKHEIKLIRIADRIKGSKYPKCLNGERACPPEDCGGAWGYEELLETISNPEHEEYENMMEWLDGNFDPESFDSNSIKFDNPKKRWEFAFCEQ